MAEDTIQQNGTALSEQEISARMQEAVTKGRAMGIPDAKIKEGINNWISGKRSGVAPQSGLYNPVVKDEHGGIRNDGTLTVLAKSIANGLMELPKATALIEVGLGKLLSGDASAGDEALDDFNKLIDGFKFDIHPDNMRGVLEQDKNGDYHLTNWNSLVNVFGQSVPYMLGGWEAGAAAKALGAGANGIKAASLAGTALATTPMVYDAGKKAGLDNANAIALSLAVSPGIAALENIGMFVPKLGGVESQIMSGLLRNPETRTAVSNITKEAIGKELANIGTKGITQESFNQIAKATTKGIFKDVIVPTLKNTGKQALVEGGEEFLQDALQNSAEAFYDQVWGKGKEVGQGKFGTELLTTDPNNQALGISIGGYGVPKKEFLGYANGVLGGFAIGAGMSSADIRRSPAFNQTLYGYIDSQARVGKAEDALTKIKDVAAAYVKMGKMSPEEAENAVQRTQQMTQAAQQTRSVPHENLDTRTSFDVYNAQSNLLPEFDERIGDFEQNFGSSTPEEMFAQIENDAIIIPFERGAKKKALENLYPEYKRAQAQKAVVSKWLEDVGANGKSDISLQSALDNANAEFDVGRNVAQAIQTIQNSEAFVAPEENEQGQAEVITQQKAKPIRQLSSGANVYHETENGYRVNDNQRNGKTIAIIPIDGDNMSTNAEFDTPEEAVSVTKKIAIKYPNGIPKGTSTDGLNQIISEAQNEPDAGAIIGEDIDNLENELHNGIEFGNREYELEYTVATDPQIEIAIQNELNARLGGNTETGRGRNEGFAEGVVSNERRKESSGEISEQGSEIQVEQTNRPETSGRNQANEQNADKAKSAAENSSSNKNLVKRIRKKVQSVFQKFEPRNTRESIVKYFAGGGRINTQSLISDVGMKPGSEEYKSKLWAHSKKAPTLDNLAQLIAEQFYGNETYTEADTQEIGNQIIDVLQSNAKRDLSNYVKDAYNDQQFHEQYGMSKSEYDYYSSQAEAEKQAEMDYLEANGLLLSEQEQVENILEDAENSLTDEDIDELHKLHIESLENLTDEELDNLLYLDNETDERTDTGHDEGGENRSPESRSERTSSEDVSSTQNGERNQGAAELEALLKDASSRLSKTEKQLYDTQKKIAELQSQQTDMFGRGNQSDMFGAPSAEETRQTLIQLQNQVKEVRAEVGKLTQQKEDLDKQVAGQQEITFEEPPFQKSNENFKQITKEQFDRLISRLTNAFKGLGKGISIISTETQLQEALKKSGYTQSQLNELKTNTGEIYGAVLPDGNIYLNENNLNANTPIHEFGHLWTQVMKQSLPGLYERTMEVVKKDTALMNEIRNDQNYVHLNTDEQIADEALSRSIGNIGEESFWNDDKLTGRQRTLRQRLWEAVKLAWSRLKNYFGKNNEDIRNWTDEKWNNATVSELSDAISKELLSGEQIKEAQDLSINGNEIKLQIQAPTEQQLDDARLDAPKDLPYIDNNGNTQNVAKTLLTKDNRETSVLVDENTGYSEADLKSVVLNEAANAFDNVFGKYLPKLENKPMGRWFAQKLEQFLLNTMNANTFYKMLYGGENSAGYQAIKTLMDAQWFNNGLKAKAKEYIKPLLDKLGENSLLVSGDFEKSANLDAKDFFEKYTGDAKLTEDEALGIYLSLLDETERERFFAPHHGKGGTFTLKEQLDKYDKRLRKATEIEVTQEDFAKLQDRYSTPEWTEIIDGWKKAAELLHKHATKTRETLFGKALGKVRDFYFPLIHGDGEAWAKTFMEYNHFVTDVKNLKSRSEENNKDYLALGALQVMNGYIDNMSTFASYGVPLHNVKTQFGYIEDFLRDNGKTKWIEWHNKFTKEFEDPNKDKLTNFEKKFLSKFVVSKLGMNAFIVGKQYSSLMIAMNSIKPKYLASAAPELFSGAGKVIKSINVLKDVDLTDTQKEMAEHSRFAAFRLAGGQNYFEQYVQQVKDYKTSIAGKEVTIPFSRFAQQILAADSHVSAVIWQAAKAQIKAETNLQEGSKEYWDAVSELHKKTIIESQSSIDEVNKAHAVKDAGMLMRAFTFFGGQSFSNWNTIMSNYLEYANNPTQENKDRVARGLTSVFLLNTMMVVAIDALKYGIGDDDDDDTKGKIVRSMYRNAFNNMPIAGELLNGATAALSSNGRFGDMSYPLYDVINDGYKTIAALKNADFNEAVKEGVRFGAEVTGVPLFPFQNPIEKKLLENK